MAAVEIKVPSAGESVTEAVLNRWIKKDGDSVRRDEPVAELLTDKAGSEVLAPVSGTLHTAAAEGDTVAVGSVIGRVEEGAVAPAPRTTQPAVAPTAKPAAVVALAPAAGMSPSARVLVESKGIDTSGLSGSGRGGRIIKEDVLAAKSVGNGAPAATAVPARAPGERETRTRMTALRQRIAARLIESQQTTATLTTFNEVDMSAINELRARYKDKFKEKYGVNLGFSSFFVKAAVEALKAFPIVNARIDGPDVVQQHFYDISVAVSTDKGLMTPVLRDCDSLTFAGIEKGVAALATKAREGRIGVTDLQGGTFTITNGGIFGSLLSTPILNPPQTAILGMHAIQRRPVAVGERVEIRPMMYLALSYDHRLIDGREAVQFLVRIKECLETPERLMLEI